jgi:glycerol kinase
MTYLLALDQGTTSSRAIVFDESANVVAMRQQVFGQHYPRSGWVEHDPEEIWSSQLAVAEGVLQAAGLQPHEIVALGITNQRETIVAWDKVTGRALHQAIVWQDRRTASACDKLRADGREPMVVEKTGLLLDPYFSASKIAWLLQHVAAVRQAADDDRLACGTIDAWLVYRLTGGRLHVTDASNASRTQLMNIHDGDWDDELLDCFGVPRGVLPEIRSSSEVYDQVDHDLPLAGIPIAGVAGDQQAAMFGQACFEKGSAKNTYGTGCFLLMNTGEHAAVSQHKLLTTVAWRQGGRTEYALEGSVFMGGAVVGWLRDGLGIIKDSSEVEKLANSVADTDGVFLVPAFTGLGAPHWDPYARGTILGITQGTSAGHLARAALESIALQVADLLEAMHGDSAADGSELRVDGGASVNDTLMQCQADLLQAAVTRPKVTETTALGAAYLAGLAVGVWPSRDAVASQWCAERTFEPRISADEAQAKRASWQRAVARSTGWAQDENGSHVSK